jgi:adenine-specific DNA-methyltransferase
VIKTRGLALPPSECKVYTPTALAKAMVAVVGREHRQWLEPSCGKGVFLKAIRDRLGARAQATGVDLDPIQASADKLGTVLRGVDFLDWSRTQKKRFDCIIGNPPFVAIRSLPPSLRDVAADVRTLSGDPIGIRANTWYAFVLQSIRLLKRGGSLAFVLPSAAEYANYSSDGRARITSEFDRVDLIRSRRPLFESVQEGTIVLVCRGKGGLGNTFRRHLVADVNAAIRRLGDLEGAVAKQCPPPPPAQTDRFVRLDEVVDIRLGGVTGDARYFVFSESKRKELGIPRSSVVPVVSKSHHVASGALSSNDWESLRNGDERIWLFRPTPKAVHNKAVSEYLELASNSGGCRRQNYKVRNRNPWYTTPLPSQVDGFITGMSDRGAWICFNETDDVNATNTLYVVSFKDRLGRQSRYAWGLSLLTSPARQQIRRITRRYADGLSKLEPGGLGGLHLPLPPRIPNAVSVYQDAVRHLMRGDERTARRIADDAIFGASCVCSRVS